MTEFFFEAARWTVAGTVWIVALGLAAVSVRCYRNDEPLDAAALVPFIGVAMAAALLVTGWAAA